MLDHFLKMISYVQLPNVLGFTLGLLQMLLYAIYNKGSKVSIKEDYALNPMTNVVVVNPLGTCEVVTIPDIDIVTTQGKDGAEEKEKNVENLAWYI